MRSRHLAVPLAVALTFAVGAAHAQTDNRAESDRLFEEGLALANQNDFEHAKDKFAAAYAKFPSPNSLANLARSEQLSNHCIDAVKHYRAYVALPANPRVTDADRNDARKGITACRQTLGTLLITAPAGTAVDVDGVAIALTQENAIEVTVGPHKVTLNGTAGVRVRDVSAEAGKDTLCEYDPKETANGAGTPQAPGSHEKLVRPVVGWIVPGIVGAVGLVGVGLGIGFGVASSSAANDARALETPGVCATSSATCTALRSHASDANSAGAVSVAGYVAGGVLLGVAIVMAIVWPKHADVVVAPSVTTQGAELSIVGRF